MAGRKLGTVEGVTPLGEGWGKDIGGGDTAKRTLQCLGPKEWTPSSQSQKGSARCFSSENRSSREGSNRIGAGTRAGPR